MGCTEDGVEPLKERYYRKVFNKNYSMRFTKPKTDSCDTYDHFDIKIVDAQNFKDQAHLRNVKARKAVCLAKAEQVYQQLKNDTEWARDDSSLACFDL